ncbi:MAG: hypothetical protein KBG47_02180 [Bacteroidia bacterium]|nr:hypothetical protein [Bacteroidia bacterium]
MVRNILFFFIFILIFSCKKTFKPATDAFFVNTEKVTVITQPGQGYGSHNITDLWLYTNGDFKGAYPIGAKMPVMIEDGKSVINVFAGIKNNGISETRINWLFYEPIKLDTVVASGQNIVRNFAFKYRTSVVFPWVEGFELPGFSLIRSSISDTTYKLHTNDEHVFEGNKSIELGLSGSALTAQLETATTHSLPLSTSNVYLEIDYKSNTDFIIGTSTNGVFYESITITPKENWHKIYVHIAESVNMDKTTSMKKIIIKIKRNQNISEQKVYIDNLKLVYI